MEIAIAIPDYQSRSQLIVRKEYPASFGDLKAAKIWVQQQLRAHGIEEVSPLRYACESTGCYHFPLLHAWGDQPTVVNPVKTRLGARKTDRVDAKTLAEGDLAGRWGWSFTYTMPFQVARTLLRRRKKSQGVAKLMGQFVSRCLLMWGYSFQMIGSTTGPVVRPIVEDLLAGRVPVSPEAQDNWSGLVFPEHLRQALLDAYKDYDQFTLRTKVLTKQVEQLACSLEYPRLGESIPGKELFKLLQTIPGIGPLSAVTAMLEIADLTRFNTVKGCLAWAGFDPTLRISAGKVTAFVTRKGTKLLHYVLIEAAHVAGRGSTPLGLWAQRFRLKQKKGAAQRTAQATARRILMGIYYVWLKRESWKAAKDEKTSDTPSDSSPSPAELGNEGRGNSSDGGEDEAVAGSRGGKGSKGSSRTPGKPGPKRGGSGAKPPMSKPCATESGGSAADKGGGDRTTRSRRRPSADA